MTINDRTHYSLVFPVIKKDGLINEVLLAEQQDGMWSGYLNGFGGKIEEKESIFDGACRELKEESGITLDRKKLLKVGTLYFENKHAGYINTVHLFITELMVGLHPLDVINAEYYYTDRLPWERMPPDDHHWLPQIFNGDYVEAIFTYDMFGDNTYLSNIKYNPGGIPWGA